MAGTSNPATAIDLPITDPESPSNLSTSALLYRCKRQIIRPYQRLLALIGLKPMEQRQASGCVVVLTLSMIVVACLLSYMYCMHRHGCYTFQGLCHDHPIFSYFIPSGLQFIAYLQGWFTMRVLQTERLEMLIEKTFLFAANRPAGVSANAVARTLWLCIGCSIIWIIASTAVVIYLLTLQLSVPRWIDSNNGWSVVLQILLVFTTFWQDLIQVTIIASYCLQVLLLAYTFNFLRVKLLLHTIPILEWVREVSECQQTIHYLNEDLGLAVSFYILLDVAWAGTGIFCFFRNPNTVESINILFVCLWLYVILLPIAAAAHLTSVCNSLRNLGQAVRARPFVYQSTPAKDLDTLLLFTSSLRLKAKLWGLPVNFRHLFFITFMVFAIVLIFGQSNLF